MSGRERGEDGREVERFLLCSRIFRFFSLFLIDEVCVFRTIVQEIVSDFEFGSRLVFIERFILN